ncbi:MAG: MotA/TolQ/ExbB proton channel family protein [Thermoguttaceae bacterium]|nr:MotA/TolQ/ExbB proton channel family protein [Thermoguttaceae bacterium]
MNQPEKYTNESNRPFPSTARGLIRTAVAGIVGLCLAKLVLCVLTVTMPTRFEPTSSVPLMRTSVAQEVAADAPADAAAAPAGEAAPAAAAVAPADAAAKDASKAKAPETKAKTKSYFTWFIESSGLIGLLILTLSILFVARVCQLFVEYRIEIAVPHALLDRIQNHLAQSEYREVYQILQNDPSILAKLLVVGITELPAGKDQARDTMERYAESLQVDMEKRISLLSVLGTLGPMIGLLGTLKGMIASFSVIAMSDTQMKASEVAGGISEALLLTFEGVGLSVPAIWFYSVFRNRVMTIMTTASYEADRFLRQFADQINQQQTGQ